MALKTNTLKLLLEEAKKHNLKWLVQQDGANLFPNEDDYYDYDNWKFTKDVQKTVAFVKDIGNDAYIVFDKGGWVRYVRQYNEPDVEDIADWTTSLTWVDELSDRLEEMQLA